MNKKEVFLPGIWDIMGRFLVKMRRKDVCKKSRYGSWKAIEFFIAYRSRCTQPRLHEF